MTKFIVFGLGFLGSYVLSEIKNNDFVGLGTNYEHSSNNSKQTDIRNYNDIDSFLKKENPDIVINCVAVGKINFLEQNPEIAYSVNSIGAKNIAKSCHENNVRMIHISTDSIFDGKKELYSENDIPSPLNVYAKSKALAEQYVMDSCKNSVIVRTNFYGFNPNGKWFFNWILDSLQKSKNITGFQDIYFNPLEISNLSKLLLELSLSNFSGIIHLAANEILTKYDFIERVIKVFGFDEVLLSKGSYEKDRVINGTISLRPKNTTLSNNLSKTILNTPLISLNESLLSIKQNFYD